MKHIVKTLQRFIYILNSVNSKFIIENYIYIYAFILYYLL